MSLPIKRFDVEQNSREGLHLVLEFQAGPLSKAHVYALRKVVPAELLTHAEDGSWHVAAQAAPELRDWLRREGVQLALPTLVHLGTLADHELRRRDLLTLRRIA
jgi:hypothetical protein